MKTSIHPSHVSVPVHAANDDAQIAAEFDELVRSAVAGDRRAIGAIAIAFGPKRLHEARAVLGSRFKQEAEDVVQDFFVSLLEGQSRFAPAQGRAIPWMCGVVRAIARKARGDRCREWAIDDES
jgi:DNA-directed RNA polymerase specialized sigma24 family protein